MRASWIVLLFAAAHATAQTPNDDKAASEAETRAVADIIDCMVAGLPDGWYRATMEINLEKPEDETGSVRYGFARDDNTPPSEPFQPCDVKKPARIMIELRSKLPPARRGWIGVNVTVLYDGRFGIHYGYPQAKPKPKP
jgi:hypothetical protein